jgi:hypothetical protein
LNEGRRDKRGRGGNVGRILTTIVQGIPEEIAAEINY